MHHLSMCNQHYSKAYYACQLQEVIERVTSTQSKVAKDIQLFEDYQEKMYKMYKEKLSGHVPCGPAQTSC